MRAKTRGNCEFRSSGFSIRITTFSLLMTTISGRWWEAVLPTTYGFSHVHHDCHSRPSTTSSASPVSVATTLRNLYSSGSSRMSKRSRLKRAGVPQRLGAHLFSICHLSAQETRPAAYLTYVRSRVIVVQRSSCPARNKKNHFKEGNTRRTRNPTRSILDVCEESGYRSATQ